MKDVQFYLKIGGWFSPIIFLQNLLFKWTLCKISEVPTLLRLCLINFLMANYNEDFGSSMFSYLVQVIHKEVKF